MDNTDLILESVLENAAVTINANLGGTLRSAADALNANLTGGGAAVQPR